MRYLLLLLSLTLLACGHRMDAINWYLRIEHTEDCGDYGLYGGAYNILCPVQDAIWNGDTLVVKSAEVCYYINATDYKDNQPLEEIPCQAFREFIGIAPSYWARGAGPNPE
ncbi:MAG: hypothetical protein AAF597_10675 [Bacteroidota bacterium]